MFKVSADPRFTHEVKVMVPVDGGHTQQTFRATFRALPIDELTGDDDPGDPNGSNAALLKRVIVDLNDLLGDDDKPLTYSDELRDRLIGVPYVRVALMSTYIAAITKARAGN